MDNNRYCIIMAGGSGTRFWPMSRVAKPKQFLDILDMGKPFLRMTYNRFTTIIPPDNVLIVASEQYRDLIKEQLPQIPDENILLEPLKRNTAPCIAYAIYKLRKKNPDATVVITPADHYITGEANFTSSVARSLDFVAHNDQILTIGIEPTRPDTNYGYIQMNRASHRKVEGHPIYAVKTFTEKPDVETAKVFCSTGEFLWNSGMFISNIRSLIAEFEKCLPEVASLFAAGDAVWYTPAEKEFVLGAYRGSPNISIDYGVMEKTRKAWVVPADFGWSDLGTWTTVYDLSPNKDADGNIVKVRESIVQETKGTLVREKNTDKLVVVRGLEDFLVIDTDDVLMICPRNDKYVKEFVTDLTAREKNRYL